MIAGVAGSQITEQVTTTPIISNVVFATVWKYDVWNRDALSVTAYADHNGTNPPTTSRGTVAAGAHSTTISAYSFGGFTIYARAQASGKSMSLVTSYYVAE